MWIRSSAIFALTQIFFFVSLVFATHAAAQGEDASAQPRNAEAFEELIRYEYTNVLMTHRMMQELARITESPEQVFWQAYADLESFNLTMYIPLSKVFDIDPTVTWWTGVRADASVLAARLFPSVTIRSINRLANNYVDRLRMLHKASPPAFDLFFEYVVAQEELQIEFLPDAMAGDYIAASDKVQRFLTRHRDTQTKVLELLNVRDGHEAPSSETEPTATPSIVEE